MNIEDPWANIIPPKQNAGINGRRIPGLGTPEWGLYWGLDSHGRCLLILEHQSDHIPSRRLPKLSGLLVESQPMEIGSGERLIIRLVDGEQRELFHRFCVDISDTTRQSQNKGEAASSFLSRTWRWHRLLRGSRDLRLNNEEQKGLIGELYVLEHHLIHTVGPTRALQAWKGPELAPKDFQLSRIGIEAKTRSPLSTKIKINSAEQLDTMGTARLFLHVVEVSQALGNSSSVTITNVASRVRDIIASIELSALDLFEERLKAAEFDWGDDYSDNPFLIGEASLYEVQEGFPRISPLNFQSGVEDVKYSITLSRCERFRVDMTVLNQDLFGGASGD